MDVLAWSRLSRGRTGRSVRRNRAVPIPRCRDQARVWRTRGRRWPEARRAEEITYKP